MSDLLTQLPQDTLLTIIHHLPSVQDIIHAGRTCHVLRHVVQEYLSRFKLYTVIQQMIGQCPENPLNMTYNDEHDECTLIDMLNFLSGELLISTTPLRDSTMPRWYINDFQEPLQYALQICYSKVEKSATGNPVNLMVSTLEDTQKIQFWLAIIMGATREACLRNYIHYHMHAFFVHPSLQYIALRYGCMCVRCYDPTVILEDSAQTKFFDNCSYKSLREFFRQLIAQNGKYSNIRMVIKRFAHNSKTRYQFQSIISMILSDPEVHFLQWLNTQPLERYCEILGSIRLSSGKLSVMRRFLSWNRVEEGCKKNKKTVKHVPDYVIDSLLVCMDQELLDEIIMKFPVPKVKYFCWKRLLKISGMILKNVWGTQTVEDVLRKCNELHDLAFEYMKEKWDGTKTFSEYELFGSHTRSLSVKFKKSLSETMYTRLFEYHVNKREQNATSSKRKRDLSEDHVPVVIVHQRRKQ